MPAVFNALSLGDDDNPILSVPCRSVPEISLCNSFICYEAKGVKSLKEHGRTLLLELSYLRWQSEFLLLICFLIWCDFSISHYLEFQRGWLFVI